MRVSWRRIAVGVALAVLGSAAPMMVFYPWEAKQVSRERVVAERAQRQTPVAEIAPAPLPAGVPLLGVDGQDSDGYPTRYVDRAALRALLWHKRYTDLTRYLEGFQAAFEADPRREYWPADAGEAFRSAEPSLLPALDAWVEATPASFGPYLARGNHWVEVAYARRGTKWARETAREDFVAMEEALERGMVDLDRAIALRPALVAAQRAKIHALKSLGAGQEMRQTVDDALAVCPACLQVRAAFMTAIIPRWGGSYEAMRRFAQEVDVSLNPRLRVLPGYIEMDRAQLLVIDGQNAKALTAIERACALGEYWEFLEERADIRNRLNDRAGALADAERALAARPGHPRLVILRGYLRGRAQQWEAAGRDLLAGLRMEPTNSLGRFSLDTTVRGLVSAGWAHHQAGRHQEALQVFDLAADLAPLDRDVQSRRHVVIAGTSGASDEDVARLDEEVRRAPDDFRALQRLDHALLRRREFQRIVDLCTAYLSRHPQEGLAYLERGGAHFHLGRLSESRADARTACGLGVSEGCAREEQVAGLQK
jgi:tetratricopeptide (TPR) repeat protein